MVGGLFLGHPGSEVRLRLFQPLVNHPDSALTCRRTERLPERLARPGPVLRPPVLAHSQIACIWRSSGSAMSAGSASRTSATVRASRSLTGDP